MKTILALAGVALLSLSAPSIAQNAGAPGATGTGGSLTGSNTGTGFNGQGSNEGYSNSPGNGGRGYLDEGRAAAPDSDMDSPNRGYRQRGVNGSDE